MISMTFVDSSHHYQPLHHITVSSLFCSRGMCLECGQTLERLQVVGKEEFSTLKLQLVEKSLKREDVFLNSSPEELRRFRKFIRDRGPFDVVIDGLNVAFAFSKRSRIRSDRYYQVTRVTLYIQLHYHTRKSTNLYFPRLALGFSFLQPAKMYMYMYTLLAKHLHSQFRLISFTENMGEKSQPKLQPS